MNGFDVKELEAYEKKLLRLAAETMPKETKKYLNKEGVKLKNATVKSAKSKVGTKDGDYIKSIKKGKVYKYKGNGGLAIRTYSSKPHAHLIEYGHRQVLNPYEDGKVANIGKRFSKGVKPGKGIGKEIGYVKGKFVFEDARNKFKDTFFKDTEKFIDDVLEKGL